MISLIDAPEYLERLLWICPQCEPYAAPVIAWVKANGPVVGVTGVLLQIPWVRRPAWRVVSWLYRQTQPAPLIVLFGPHQLGERPKRRPGPRHPFE